MIPDDTKVLIAMGMLLANTNSSIRLALKGINVLASFKDTLRDNVRFLEEHGGSAGSHAHILQDSLVTYIPMWDQRNISMTIQGIPRYCRLSQEQRRWTWTPSLRKPST